MGLGVIAIGALFAFRSANSSADDVEAMRRIGVATTDQEFNAMAPLTGSNAAPLYIDFTKHASLLRGNDRASIEQFEELLESQHIPGRPTTAEIKKLQPMAVKLAPLTDLVRNGAKMDRCYFGSFEPRIGRSAAQDHFKDLINTWQAADVLGGTALCEAQDGKPVQAIHDLSLACRVMTQISQNPGSQGFFSSAGETFLMQAWHRVLQDNATNAEVIAASLSEIEKLPQHRDLVSLFKSSYNGYLWSYQRQIENPSKYAVEEDGKKPLNYYGQLKWVKAIHQRIHIDRKVFEAMPSDETDISGIKSALQLGEDEGSKSWPLNEGGKGDLYGTQRRVIDLHTRIATLRSETYALTRLLADRLKSGNFPDALPDYGPRALDPGTRGPLQYQRVGNGFRMSSPLLVGYEIVIQ